METELCKINFHDGSWIKAEIPTGADLVDYVLDQFGMFSSIESLPIDDAAAIARAGK